MEAGLEAVGGEGEVNLEPNWPASGELLVTCSGAVGEVGVSVFILESRLSNKTCHLSKSF